MTTLRLLSASGDLSDATLNDSGAYARPTSPLRSRVAYAAAHVVPRMSAPSWLADGPLADPENPLGYVQVDKHTLQHTRYPDVFSIGDASSVTGIFDGATPPRRLTQRCR